MTSEWIHMDRAGDGMARVAHREALRCSSSDHECPSPHVHYLHSRGLYDQGLSAHGFICQRSVTTAHAARSIRHKHHASKFQKKFKALAIATSTCMHIQTEARSWLVICAFTAHRTGFECVDRVWLPLGEVG